MSNIFENKLCSNNSLECNSIKKEMILNNKSNQSNHIGYYVSEEVISNQFEFASSKQNQKYRIKKL